MFERSLWLLIAMLILPCLPARAADPEDLAGSITNITGPVEVLRGGETIQVEKGARLYLSDVIRTGDEAGVGIVLRDDTTLSLGPSSELKMSAFAFEPDAGILSLTLSIFRGTLVYVSGQIAKLAPGSVQIETPAGVAAVRGTELLVEVHETRAQKRARQKQ